MTRFKWRLWITVLAAVAIVTSPLGGDVAYAHVWDICGDGHQLRWGGTSTTHWYPSTWDVSYRDAISGAQAGFNGSDFDYFTSTQTSALLTWQDLNNPDTNIAGYASIVVFCNTHNISSGTLYFNFPHFQTAHTVAEKQCVAIHEMGHGAGFWHNEVISVLRTDHNTQCHVNQWKTLQTHDLNDVNTVY